MQTTRHPYPSSHDRARPSLFDVHPFRLASLVLAGSLLCGATGAGCARVNGGDSPGTGGSGYGWIGGSGGGPGGKFAADSGLGDTVSCNGGDACMCPPFRLAVVGKPGKWGANSGGDPDTALQDWLNSNSAGTAQVDNFTARTKLTPEFLARYNVIILAGLADDSNNGPWWTFSADEVAAFSAWVQNGGGVISLSGYTGNGGEIAPVNQLIQFSGITYNQDTVSGTCSDAQTCSCTESNTVSDWNRTDPAIAQLVSGMTLVGFRSGRGIVAPSDSHVAATAEGTRPVLVGKAVGAGRVIVYSDEWVTYTSQWTGAGLPGVNDPNCAGHLPQEKYQMAQFWYNLIRWAQPSATCFMIVGPVIIG